MVWSILGATATIVASVFGSLTVVEYRLHRERQWNTFRDEKQWLVRAEQLSDQIIRECTDLQGRFDGVRTREELVADGILTELDERVQLLKDHISKAPSDIDPNIKHKIDDVWVKYALLDSSPVTMEDINTYPKPAAEKCKTELENEIDGLEEPPTLFDYLRTLFQKDAET